MINCSILQLKRVILISTFLLQFQELRDWRHDDQDGDQAGAQQEERVHAERQQPRGRRHLQEQERRQTLGSTEAPSTGKH